MKKLKFPEVQPGHVLGPELGLCFPPPTHRPLPALSGHVAEDGHRHAGPLGVDEVHAVGLVALAVDVVAVQGLLKAGLLQSWGPGRGRKGLRQSSHRAPHNLPLSPGAGYSHKKLQEFLDRGCSKVISSTCPV